jgi:hypothetical protein
MKKVPLGIVSVVGQRETAPHDLIGKFWEISSNTHLLNIY